MADQQQFVGTPTLSERLKNPSEVYKVLAKNISSNLRVAMPGVIASFDANKQTVEVDLVIYDRIAVNLPQALANYSPTTGDIKIPTLIDVPIVLPRGGSGAVGAALTFPIQPGDECLVIVADMCYNEWFDAGGINNVQQVLRRHDLSDAFAILGPWSQPRALLNYSTTSTQLRTEDGATYLDLDASGPTLSGPTVTLDGLLALTGAGVPSVAFPSISLPVTLNGVTYYLKLSSTP